MAKMGYIIFDLDGTIIDDMHLHAEVFSQLLSSEYRIEKDISKKHYFDTAGIPLNVQFKFVRDNNAISDTDIDILISKFDEEVLKSAKDNLIKPFPEVEVCLQQLIQAGYKLIISSSGSSNLVHAKLKSAGINKYFFPVLGSEPPNSKGTMTKGVDHFEKIKKELNIPPKVIFNENSVMVGDSIHDINIARDYKMVAIGRVNHENIEKFNEIKPDFIIYDLTTLVNRLSNENYPNGFQPISKFREDIIMKAKFPTHEMGLIQAEYESLRNEILKRIEIRHQIVALHFVIASTFLTIGTQENIPPIILLFYPILTMFVAAGWARNDIRIGHIGAYIRDNIEVRTEFVKWESHRNISDAKKRFLWLSAFRIFSTIGLFQITQLLAIGLSLQRLSFNTEEVVLLIIDISAFILTSFFLFIRRGI